MRIAIGADHAGYPLKAHLVEHLGSAGHSIADLGTNSTEAVDYPPYCASVGRAVARGRAQLGIVVGGSGQGEQLAANKIRGVRAALCNDLYSARMARLHNDANVLSMGGRVIGLGLAEEITQTFLDTAFAGGRHARRVDQVMALEGISVREAVYTTDDPAPLGAVSLPDDINARLVDAAVRAPGGDACRFVTLTDPDVRARVAGAHRQAGGAAGLLDEAPLLVAVFAPRGRAADGAMAAWTMCLAARGERLGARYADAVAGHTGELDIGLPDHEAWELVALVGVGAGATTDVTGRRAAHETAHAERWGERPAWRADEPRWPTVGIVDPS